MNIRKIVVDGSVGRIGEVERVGVVASWDDECGMDWTEGERRN